MSDQKELYLTAKELSARLRRPDGTLRNWRYRRFGPPWIKLGKEVLYPLAGVEKWELERMRG